MSADNRPSAERVAQIHFDYALTGILETDAQLVIGRANPAASSILQRTPKALLQHSLDRLLTDRDGRFTHHLALLREQGINHVALDVAMPDGQSRILDISSIQADEDVFIHVIDDVTETRRHARELEEARQAAEDASRAKDDFLANVSHELRTPLNGIMGLTRLTLASPLDATQREHLEMVLQASNNLLLTLNDLLDFAKIGAGKLDYEQQPVDLFPLLEELAALVASAAPTKPLELVFHLAPGVPQAFTSDPVRLRQILINLLNNALKFTEHGHVALHITIDGPLLRFSIRDSGIGIRDEALGRLFRPFSQADGSTTRRYGGTGLGLVIAQRLARGLGGELTATSRWGEGSEFTLSLPYEPQPQPETAGTGPLHIIAARPLTAAALRDLATRLEGKEHDGPGLTILDLADEALPGPNALRHLHGPHILLSSSAACARLPPAIRERHDLCVLPRPLTPLALQNAAAQLRAPQPPMLGMADDIPAEFSGATIAVAEDVPLNQRVICGILARAGIHVILATNGRELLDKLTGQRADLVLMDIHMPELDGFEATRQLRARGWRGPIVGLSASTQPAEQNACNRAGMDDFLAKPVDLDELWGLLTRWLPPRDRRTAMAPASPPAPAVAQPPSGSAPSLPPDGVLIRHGVDAPQALERFLDNRTALAEALGQFAAQHGQDARNMRSLWLSGDHTAVMRLAHSIKGVSAALGAGPLHHLACAVEHLAPDTAPPLAAGLFDALETALAQVLAIMTPD